jgi:hypothetical protein
VSLCPEAAERAAMSDDEFWEHVLHVNDGPDHDPGIPDDIEMAELFLADPCPECGSRGACGYDQEGRPMIHAIDGGSDG